MLQQAAPLTAEPPQTLRKEFRATLALAVPLAAANLLQMLVHAIDVIFVARLGDAIVSLLNDPAFVEQIRTTLGAEPVGMTSQAMGAFMAKDTEKVTRIITQLGIRGD